MEVTLNVGLPIMIGPLDDRRDGDAAAIVLRLVESHPTRDDADTLPGGHSS